MKMRKKRGISPLISVIMLIAFTMIVAGILAGWATQFMTQSRSELQRCSKAQLLIQRAYYENTTQTLTLALYNTGSVPLSGFSVVLTYQNETVTANKFEALNISSLDIKTIAMPTDDTLDEIIIQSMECKSAQDMINRYDIQGLGFRSI